MTSYHASCAFVLSKSTLQLAEGGEAMSSEAKDLSPKSREISRVDNNARLLSKIEIDYLSSNYFSAQTK